VPLAVVARMASLNPGIVYQGLVSDMPERFSLAPGVVSLDFFYDLATFRAGEDATGLEVYYGVSPDMVAFRETPEGPQLHLDRTVVLTDRKGEVVRQVKDRPVFGGSVASSEGNMALVVDVAFLDAPPGDYRLAVQLTDLTSGKLGIYQQDITVPVYADSLAMSDLEMAWVVSGSRQPEKFRKGEIWVVPMPSRSYRKGQTIYVYYEVYNLLKDAYGQTRYRVSYAIRGDIRKRGSILGVLTGSIRRLLTSGKPEVAVSYEREGTDAWEPVYIALDPDKLKPGLNQIEVTVTDLNRDIEVSRKTVFGLE